MIIRPGELRSIIGPNGAGKTTMMDVITGKTKPDLGEVLFNGDIDLTRLDETAIANLGIGRKFQKPTVFENLGVFENLELALKDKRGVWPTMFGAPPGRAARPHRRDPETIGLADRAGERAGRLATARSNGSRSACCWSRTRSFCCSTSRWRA